MELIAIQTTLPNAEQAHNLAHHLVERSLAACVQIDAITSVYRWQGAVQQESEYRLVCKTLRARSEAVLTAIRERHPYELPELLILQVDQADPAYARWVAQACGAGAETGG